MKSIKKFKDNNIELNSIIGGRIRTEVDGCKDYQFTLLGKWYYGANCGDGWIHMNCP